MKIECSEVASACPPTHKILDLVLLSKRQSENTPDHFAVQRKETLRWRPVSGNAYRELARGWLAKRSLPGRILMIAAGPGARHRGEPPVSWRSTTSESTWERKTPRVLPSGENP